jgi:hypothetical protein
MAGGSPTKYPGDDEAGKVIESYITACKEAFYLPTAEGLGVSPALAAPLCTAGVTSTRFETH